MRLLSVCLVAFSHNTVNCTDRTVFNMNPSTSASKYYISICVCVQMFGCCENPSLTSEVRIFLLTAVI